MSAESIAVSGGEGTPEAVRLVLDAWMEGLAQVLESMAEQLPKISWQAAGVGAATPLPEAELLWWEQPLEGVADATVWVGSPAQTWQHAGTLALQAAGLETAATEEARNTWLEILGQSLAVMARSISAAVKREVLCGAGAERPAAADAACRASATMAFGEVLLPPLTLVFSPGVVALLGSTPQPDSADAAPAPGCASTAQPAVKTSRTMELLLDVELPVSISFGKTRLPLRDVLQLTTGSIVELNRTATDPVDVLVNQRLVARGEVVVVEGNYGVRIQEIASRQDRLRSIP